MKLSVKSISQLNWLMAIVSAGFLSVFLFSYSGFDTEAVYVIIKSAVDVLVISFFHVLILIQINKKQINFSSRHRRIYRYSITYLITLAYSLGTSPVRELFADKTWRVVSFNQHIITTIVSSLGLNTFILIVHNLVIAYLAKRDTEIENAQLKASNAEATSLLLKQQIHPHFLFNALNILKSLYKKNVNAGDTYIVHLANFLRAAISNTSSSLASLNDEISLCADYIAMQKIRFGNALQYNMNISADERNKGFLPAFSLQPQLENAIKHNIITNEQPLTIHLYTSDGYVIVKNNLQRKKYSVSSTGSGLMNLIKRYQLLSGDEVIIQENEIDFSVSLKIINE